MLLPEQWLQDLKDAILRQNDLLDIEQKCKDLSKLNNYGAELEIEFKLYLNQHVIGIKS